MNQETSKLTLLSITAVGILLIVTGLFYSSFALLEPIQTISFSSNNLNYNEKVPGSWNVEKSAKWISQGKARITFDINTIRKIREKNRDIILVLDVSSSMNGSKLEKVKEDATELLNELLLNQQNKAALITFSKEATVISEFTNDKKEILDFIENLSTGHGTNYYQALISLDTFLENYEYTNERDCLVLFLTDGYPSIEIPNEKSYYDYLKEKYPYIIINGIQYEMGNEILGAIKTVSDNQYIANINTLNNVLFETSGILEPYLSFSLSDYINTEYFEIKDIKDIKSNLGTVSLDKETGKVTWILDGLNTGTTAQLTIDIYLKDKEIKDFYSTNIKETVYSNQSGVIEEVTSDKTPVLKSKYQVNYDGNLPNNCSVSNVPESKNYQIFNAVEIDNTNLKCEGYQFNGWKIATKNVKRINEDYFIMPEEDVILRAEWGKMSISKSMEGTTVEYGTPILQEITKNYNEKIWKYKDSITKIVFQDQIKDVVNSTEVWDLSEDNNYGVVGYLVPNIDNTNTYTVYIKGENQIIANKNSSYFFDGMTSLESIEGLEYLNTTNVENMNSMFRECRNLKRFDLSNFDTSKVTNMSYTFYNCSSLESLDLSNFDVSNVRYFEATFRGCSSLTSLNLNNFDTTNVTTMSDMFRECAALETLDISNFGTSNVVNMDSMFRGCSSLTSLDVSKFDTRKTGYMNSMFRGCSSLEGLNLNNFITTNVITMVDMFRECSNLTSLDLSNFNTPSVTNMDSMFRDCSMLQNLNIGRFDTSKVINMRYMFSNCSSLESLNLVSFGTTNVTTMEAIFSGCLSLKSLNVSNFNTSNVVTMYFMFYDCRNLENLDISNFNTSNVTDMYSMFRNCSSLTSLNLNNFLTSKVTTMEALFYGCSNLQSLNLDNFDTRQVINMTDMFRGMHSIQELDISSFNTSNVTNMDSMFRECRNLSSLDLSKFDTSNVTNLRGMFREMNSIQELDLSNFNTSKVTDMYSLFYECQVLSKLDISNFDTSLVTSMQNMFYVCKSLTSLDISHFNTSNVLNMRCMFYNCANLENLNLGIFDTSKVENMFSLFTYDRKLTASITISNPNITSYQDIFYGTSATMGKVTVNYKAEAEALVDAMISSKSQDANVVKGVLVTG